jgi:hypothetical protein
VRAKQQIAAALDTAERARLYARVHPPQPAPDVATLVRAELERQRRDEEAARAEAETARFRGGPCVWCGVTFSILHRLDGTHMPDWHTHDRGPECNWCNEWRGGGEVSELFDKVAVILADEGLAGLSVVQRLSFRIDPGLGAHLGVTAWIDSDTPAGTRWGHLAPLAESIEQAKRRVAEAPSGPTWDEIISLPGSEPDAFYGLTPAEIERMTSKREPLSDAEARKLVDRDHKRTTAAARRH